jgi:hypothetical protein
MVSPAAGESDPGGIDMSEMDTNPSGIEDEDVAGHSRTASAQDEDDVEGHSRTASALDDDDVEGHNRKKM